MSFRFQVGEHYRDLYQIEYVVRFFDGELAVARKGSRRYYLQSSRLEKQAPISRAISHYRSFEHPLVIPYEDVYAEDRSIVFVRPYVPIHPLREIFTSHEVEEEQVVHWVKQLVLLERDLRAQPMKMYLLLDPGNIGVTEENEELKVLFCGTETITAQRNALDWGTFLYSLLTRQHLERPIQRLPSDFKASKKLVRLIQRLLQNDSPDSILSHIKAYEKGSIFERLVGKFGEKKTDSKSRKSPVNIKNHHSSAMTPAPSAPEPQEYPVKSNMSEAPKEKTSMADHQSEMEKKKQEEDQIASLREEFEKRQKEALEKQRKELEKRQQELLERQRLEFEKREKELLHKQKEEFKQQIEEPEQRENWEREVEERERRLEEQKRREEEEKARLEKERLEQERQEQEKIAIEQEERLKKELAKVEEERIKWEQKQKDLEKKEEELRQKLQREFEEMAKSLMEKQEEEFKRRQEELLLKQRDLLESQTKKRLERHREELEQTSRHYLITPDTKPRASLLDLEREKTEQKVKKERENKKQQIEKEQQEENRERLRKEKLAQENKDHDELVKQFEEYMNQMYHNQ